MNLTDFYQAELAREVERSRKVLALAPAGSYNWKPHEKSMIFGYLSMLIAIMPSWISMEITQDELDVAPKDGSKTEQKLMDSSEELLSALDKSASEARSALDKTTDEHLMTSWRLLAAGVVVIETTRSEMIQDTFNHWAHHRGQMTVYLRLMGAKVPAIYGPSADDRSF